MIDYLYVNNYKALVNFKVRFDSINILIGKNGSGKTTILNILVLLRNFIAGISYTVQSFPRMSTTHWQESDIQTFEIGVSDDKGEFCYHLEIQHGKKEEHCLIRNENLTVDHQLIMEVKEGTVLLYNDDFELVNRIPSDMTRSGLDFVFEGASNKLLTRFKSLMTVQLLFCSPDPKNMLGYSNDITDHIYPDYTFSNIVSVYAYLSQTAPEIIFKLWNQMKEINPAFVKTRADITPFGKTIVAEYLYGDVNVSMNFWELSDGERMLMALYMLLYGYVEKGNTVLIDEPDNFLALGEIRPWCMAMEEICAENGQCLMISHHPEVIDYFADDSAIWMSRLSSGESVVTENPFYKKEEEQFMKYSELIVGGYGDEA